MEMNGVNKPTYVGTLLAMLALQYWVPFASSQTFCDSQIDGDPTLCQMLTSTGCCPDAGASATDIALADGFRNTCKKTCCDVVCTTPAPIDPSNCDLLTDPSDPCDLFQNNASFCCSGPGASADDILIAQAFNRTCVKTCCNVTCPGDLTSSPTVSPTVFVEQYVVQCGSAGGGCDPFNTLAQPTSQFFVRCCSDTAIGTWPKGKADSCPYAESDDFSNSITACQDPKSFNEAAAFCSQFGNGAARLCTAKELTDECTKGSGCGFDTQLVWTSDTILITPSPIMPSPTAAPTQVPPPPTPPTSQPNYNCHGNSDPQLCRFFLPSDCLPKQLVPVCEAMCTESCSPTLTPTTSQPSTSPTATPSTIPTFSPATYSPTTSYPSAVPTSNPTKAPITPTPTGIPTTSPTPVCSDAIYCRFFNGPNCLDRDLELDIYCPLLCGGTPCPTIAPSTPPTQTPTTVPTTNLPTTIAPTLSPVESQSPTASSPTGSPTVSPTITPTVLGARPTVVMTLAGDMLLEESLRSQFQEGILTQLLSQSIGPEGLSFDLVASDLVANHIQVSIIGGSASQNLSSLIDANTIISGILPLLPLQMSTTASDTTQYVHTLTHVCTGFSFQGQKSPCVSQFDFGFDAVGTWRLGRCSDFTDAQACDGAIGNNCEFNVTYGSCIDKRIQPTPCHGIVLEEACVATVECQYINDDGGVFSGCYTTVEVNTSGFLGAFDDIVPLVQSLASPTIAPTSNAFPSQSSSKAFIVLTSCRQQVSDGVGCITLPKQTLSVGSGYNFGRLTTVITANPSYTLGDASIAMYVTDLPPGMVFEPQTGAISGIPQASGNYLTKVWVFNKAKKLRAVAEEIEISVFDPADGFIQPECASNSECPTSTISFIWGEYDRSMNVSSMQRYAIRSDQIRSDPILTDDSTQASSCYVETEISALYQGVRKTSYSTNPFLNVKGGFCPAIEIKNCQRNCCNHKLVPMLLSTDFKPKKLFMMADGRTFVDDMAFPGDPGSWFSPCAWCGGTGELDGCVRCIEGWGKDEVGTCEPCLNQPGKTLNRHGMCVDCQCPEGSRILKGCQGNGTVTPLTHTIVGDSLVCERCKTGCSLSSEANHFFVEQCSPTGSEDNACLPCKTCTAGTFKVGGCEFDNVTRGDTICQACQTCDPLSAAPDEISLCTPTTDRVCGVLISNTTTATPTPMQVQTTTAPTSMPTGLPSPFPSPSPTPVVVSNVTGSPSTSAPSIGPSATPTASPMYACDKNCGTLTEGGGTCLNADCVDCCTSCKPSKLLVSATVNTTYYGRCLNSMTCKGRKIVNNGVMKDKKCRCTDRNCHKCVTDFNSTVCKKCRNGYYLLNDQCVASCPSQMTSMGVSTFGRKCSEPFVCQSSRVVNGTGSCKCAGPGNVKTNKCHRCEFEAGEYGQQCTRCSRSHYLRNAECHTDCSSFPGTIPYLVGTYGGECRAPFTCADGLDEQGRACRCPNSIGGKQCGACLWSVEPMICLRCASNRHYSLGACVKNCPVGEQSVINDIYGGTECKKT